MGSSNSKPEKTAALSMCKQRKRLINQAINSRHNLAAAHVSYIQSLKNIGIALRRFAEAEVLIESSISLSPTHNTTENDKTTPSSSYHPSPSLSHDDVVEVCSSEPRLSCMKSGHGGVSVILRYDPSTNIHSFVDNNDEDSLVFPMPPPPPPPPPAEGEGEGEGEVSWDYFDPGGGGQGQGQSQSEAESFRFVGLGLSNDGPEESVRLWGDEGKVGNLCKMESGVSEIGDADSSKVEEKEEGLNEEREDPSEFITHRAKDFVSSIKDIEHRFFRASESGKEVYRMLEANRIRVGYAEVKGTSSPSEFLAVCPLVCCRGKSVHAANELNPQNAPKVIVWNRSTSSHSSSSRNPLASKDDADDSGSEHAVEHFMISGSHSSTLDRLYAWERKLYDEVKASEVIRKEYDKKCEILRQQFAKDLSTHVIDKTRAVVKDLHSRIRVALHSVDSIAKRIEKMRDEELQPQLTELITGFIRMWKAMLECHHAQYITISLAYHAKTSEGTLGGETRKQIMAQLQYEFECFGLSFADWINSLTSYIEALNGWLQSCVLQPQERSSRASRRPFSPRRVVAPPIFVLCRDWSAGIKELPSEEVSDAIKNFLLELQNLVKQQQIAEDKKAAEVLEVNAELLQGKDEHVNKSGNLSSIHTSLTKVLDKLNKFSEASLKLYEDIRQKNETARVAYLNPRLKGNYN